MRLRAGVSLVAVLIVAATAASAQDELNLPRAGTGGIPLPRVIRYVAPAYPRIAVNARIRGTVVVDAIVGLGGRVESARVTRSIPLLQEAALDAVRQWQFAPISVAAGRVIVQTTFEFILGKRPPSNVVSFAGGQTGPTTEFAFDYQYDCADGGYTFIDMERRTLVPRSRPLTQTAVTLTSDELHPIQSSLQSLELPAEAVLSLPDTSRYGTGLREATDGFRVAVVEVIPIERFPTGPEHLNHTLDLWTGAGWQRLYWVEPLSVRDPPRAGVFPLDPQVKSRLSGVAEQLRQVVGREPSIRALPRDLRQCLD